MVYIKNSTGCCGLDEVYSLDEGQTAKEMLSDIAEYRYNGDSTAFYVFADAVRHRNGSRLAAYIKRQKIGQITETRSKKNPNSGRKIRVWLWDVDDAKFKAWGVKNQPPCHGCGKRNCGGSCYIPTYF